MSAYGLRNVLDVQTFHRVSERKIQEQVQEKAGIIFARIIA